MCRETRKQWQGLLLLLTFMMFWIPVIASAESGKPLAVMYEIEGDIQKKFNTMVLEKYSEIGFEV
ncbi:MAG TPA: hypothetical protein ENK86_02195, partial [Campylobacterales bacterium]|nr:hypothetical protein [Campylobacterales bacterium]